MLKNIISGTATISDYAFIILLIFIFFIPFNSHLNTYVFGIFIILTLSDRKFYKNFFIIPRFSKIVFILIFSVFLLFVISLFHTGDIKTGFKYLSPRLFLLIIPLVFSGIYYDRVQVRKLFFTFVLGVFVCSVVCIITIIFRRIQYTETGIIINYEVFQNYTSGFFQSILKRNNYFTYSRLSLFIHPAYFSLYILIAISIVYVFIRSSRLTKRLKITLSFILLYFLVFLVFLTVRASFVSLTFIFVALIFYEAHRLKNRLIPFAFTVILVFLSIYFFQTKRFSESYNDTISIIQNGFDQEKEYDARIHIWYASYNAVRKAPVFGVGIANSKSALKESFQETEYEPGVESNFNSHNQFLDIWLETGIIGLLLFLTLFIYLFIYSIKYKQFLLFIFTGVFFINLLFESILNRFAGVLFFTLFLSLLLMTTRSAFENSKA